MSKVADKKIDELEELIELAEKISSNIDNIRNQSRASLYNSVLLSFIFMVITCFGFFYYVMQDYKFHDKYEGIAKILLFIGITAFALILARFSITRQNMLKSIKNESIILGNLLNMIHSYKEVVFKEMSIVKKAVVDMRLNRIEFNKKSRLTLDDIINEEEKPKITSSEKSPS